MLLPPRALGRDDLPAETVALARFLIGMLLVRRLPEGNVSGRIVETEAYPVGDAAGHAFRGMTQRNASLFLEHGHAYVCLVRGRSYLMNVSSEGAGIGAGVLIRALEPCEGIAIMQRNRGTARLLDLARGPGRLAQALQIDRRLDGVDLCRDGALMLETDDHPPSAIQQSTRIGISRDAERLLRFYCANNRFVSGRREPDRC